MRIEIARLGDEPPLVIENADWRAAARRGSSKSLVRSGQLRQLGTWRGTYYVFTPSLDHVDE